MAFCPDNNDTLLLDGGLGTTLEDLFGKDISGPLWSAKLIDKEPEAIIQAHLAFLHAGSDAILTSTYQCAFETFERSGYSKDDAENLMRKSVRLAVRAKEIYAGDRERVNIVLSLGPYGATLSPAQEFDGIYPPPYGSQAYMVGGSNTNSFTNGDDDRASINALADFHYDRLKVFADKSDESVWPLIDAIAFETVPLAREVIAIRMAMARLKSDSAALGLAYKPWWISTVWPLGSHPQEVASGGPHLPVEYVVQCLTCDPPLPNEHGLTKSSEFAVPDGIGINCTHITDLDKVVQEMRKAIAVTDSVVPRKKFFLALYPNGGNVYDIFHHRWMSEEECMREKQTPGTWAASLANMASRERTSDVWQGIIIGGCCKTTPKHIEALGGWLKTTMT